MTAPLSADPILDTGLLRVLTEPTEIFAARRDAEAEFLARLARHGLTVLPATREQWWGSPALALVEEETG